VSVLVFSGNDSNVNNGVSREVSEVTREYTRCEQCLQVVTTVEKTVFQAIRGYILQVSPTHVSNWTIFLL
jgi:hypothetical protein